LNFSRSDIEEIVARVLDRLAGAAVEAAPPLPATPQTAGAVPEVMTVEQLAEYLQMHPQVLYRHIKRGNIPASRIGKTLRFKRSVVDRWLERTAWRSVTAEGGAGSSEPGGPAEAEG
jgi:excisionase family DNA binding protein